jgi:hypothetical protein
MKRSPFEPEPIVVMVADGQPCRVVMKKRTQSVKAISNLWRVDDSWWVTPITRFYYTLELESGSRITVFHDQTSGTWYKQNWTT